MESKILITGGNSGFGELIASKLLKDGHTVVVSMRDIIGRNQSKARELSSTGAHIVQIDVTDESSVIAGVNHAITLAEGLDVVINNAGVGAFGLLENFNPQDWQQIFDVNVFGVQRVNRAVLPQFRSQRQGLLIHISSLIGRMVLPFWGPYVASKWALEALAENYSIELSQYNIDSCIIEPGPYATRFFSNLKKPSDSERAEDYEGLEQQAKEFFARFGDELDANQGQNPLSVADAVVQLINTPSQERSVRTVVDNMGIGKYIDGYNKQYEKLTSEIFNNLGIGNM